MRDSRQDRHRGEAGTSRLLSSLQWVAVLATVSALAACDSGPSGPGTLPATVVPAAGQELGAVVLAVTGSNVSGFSPSGSTRLFSARVSQTGTYRVVLVNTAPGTMVFGVDVDDVSAEPPVVSIVQGVDAENRRLVSLLGLNVTFERP